MQQYMHKIVKLILKNNQQFFKKLKMSLYNPKHNK